jgi:hypothetical protein
LIDRVKEITDKPVEHIEASENGASPEAAIAPAATGGEG